MSCCDLYANTNSELRIMQKDKDKENENEKSSAQKDADGEKRILPEQEQWGVHKDFTIELDGATSGAVFLGRQTKFVFRARSPRLVGERVQIGLNGNGVKSFKISSETQHELYLNAKPGMNQLTLSFLLRDKREDVQLRFYAIP